MIRQLSVFVALIAMIVGVQSQFPAATQDGNFYLKLDGHPKVIRTSNANAGLPDIPKRLAHCAGCHQIDPSDGSEYVGPTLVGAMGRRVASVPGYTYSQALQAIGGVWDQDALTAFLLDTQGSAPGSTMPSLDLGPVDVSNALRALGEL